jgi:hypothetical protein
VLCEDCAAFSTGFLVRFAASVSEQNQCITRLMAIVRFPLDRSAQ